jgi:hypothetical protein
VNGSDHLANDLREVRRAGPFRGRVYLTCEARHCPVSEIELKVNEGRDGVRQFQWGLFCPRCREPAVYHGLEE